MYNTLTEIIQDIHSEVKIRSPYFPTSPVLIYMGVGTFAGLIKHDENNKIILEAENYHQYPPFIRHLKETIDDLKVFIILIDPNQENPPYMTRDENLNENFTPLDQDKFISEDERLTVYVFRKCVTADAYPRIYDGENVINITKDLEYLHRLCIENVYSFLCHDYSGRQIKYLAESFDSSLGIYLDRIIYGFNYREDTGCYFDLTGPSAFIPFRIKSNRERKSLKFFNIYKYLTTGKFFKIEMAKEKFQPFQEMIDIQKVKIIENICEDFKNHHLATLRVIHKKMNGDLEIEIHDYHFHLIPDDKKLQILDLVRYKAFHNIFDILVKHYSKDFDKISRLKGFDLSGHDLFRLIISNPNPYLWVDELQKFVL